MSDDLHGAVVALSNRIMGDTLASSASIGATTLTLGDVSDFDEAGGYLLLDGVVYLYDTIDMVADTVHLTSGLTGAGVAADAVSLWDNDNGVVVSERTALVTVDGQEDGDPLTADIDQSLAPLLAQGTLAAGQSVTLTPDGDGFRLSGVHGKNNLVTQRSTSSALVWGTDIGGGLTCGIQVTPGGTTVRLHTSTDCRVKSADASAFMPILASAFTVSSDSRLKTDVKKAPDALAIIAGAPAKVWRYKTDPKGIWRIGPMADDMPAHTVQTDDDGTLMLDLARQIGILWAAFGQQLEINKGLQSRIVKLEKGDR